MALCLSFPRSSVGMHTTLWGSTQERGNEKNARYQDLTHFLIAHASCADVWHHYSDPDAQDTFREYALWYRRDLNPKSKIYNIFGHTPVEFGVR
jgi:hypothetical protein